ncbi:endonuclease/exonuclease/phosphatase family protein [Nocardioides convexus]|uniref:endonuclease/exonuclease/phosphatase family protein n=1 Tax=Nocardioides convexus TaxID=2712224 RepID=UPI003100CC57
MLRIATVNVNGIRAAHRRGFGDWLATRGCDVVTLQEVRCPEDALPEGAFGDYHASYDLGQVAGRNGVAVLTRTAPVAVRTWSAPDPDRPLAREPEEARDRGPVRRGGPRRPTAHRGEPVPAQGRAARAPAGPETDAREPGRRR